MNQKDLQQEITKLEAQISNTQKNLNSMQENLDSMKETLQNLKDIAWDRQSKRESSSMYKVLEGNKDSTQIQSNVRAVKVDKDFMTKETKKHLDNPSLRGMVTKDELLSFPKVAKNVKPEYNPQQQGYDWRALADDGSVIKYGERDFGKGSQILTIHSETERGERGHSHRQIKDPDFHNSVPSGIISQDSNQNQAESKQKQIADMKERIKNAVNKSALSPQTPNKEMER